MVNSKWSGEGTIPGGRYVTSDVLGSLPQRYLTQLSARQLGLTVRNRGSNPVPCVVDTMTIGRPSQQELVRPLTTRPVPQTLPRTTSLITVVSLDRRALVDGGGLGGVGGVAWVLWVAGKGGVVMCRPTHTELSDWAKRARRPLRGLLRSSPRAAHGALRW